MEGNPTNKDTNIEDHLNGGSISMGTTTIAQKAPQLVLTHLVHQLEPPIDGPEYPLPVPDNTLLTLTEWVYSLDLPLRVHSLALAIVRRVSWDTGKGCWASLGTLANDARLNKREASRGFRYLKEQRIIGRKRSLSRAQRPPECGGSPAHAGIDRASVAGGAVAGGFPRPRGA